MPRPGRTVFVIGAVLATFAGGFLVDPQKCTHQVRFTARLSAYSVSQSDTVLVVGATSGIGQLVTEKLVEEGIKVRATTRSVERGREILRSSPNLELYTLNLVNDETPAFQTAVKNVSAVVISVGTTAFPTIKWKGGNTPQAIDDKAVAKLALAMSQASNVKKVVLVTSVGIERTDQMPFLILNLFGVLNAKRAGEQAIKAAGKEYIVIRPGRLVGGPFTNLDVAKLLQIQGGAENGVDVAKGDDLLGDCKRDACAECIVQCLKNEAASNIEFSMVSNEGKQALTPDQWTNAFQSMAQ